MRKTILIFGSLAAAVLLLSQLTKFSLLSADGGLDSLTALIVVGLVGAGVLIHYLLAPRSNKGAGPVEMDPEAVKKLGLSERQYDVLKLMSQGLSNREIGNSLFISESTVKTHVSQIFSKLDAKRRSQAVAKAREMGAIP